MQPEMVAPSLLVAGVGLHLTWTYVRLLVYGQRSQHWPCVEGVVSDYTVDADGSVGYHLGYAAGVVYKYEVDGQRYRSSVISHRYAFPFFSMRRILRIKQPYPGGARVTVRYDPNNPKRAVLESGVGPQNYMAAGLSLGTLGIGLLLLCSALFV